MNNNKFGEDYGFYRVAAVVPVVRLCDVEYNMEQVLHEASERSREGVRLAVFPELCLTGYTCGDLLLTDDLLDAVETALPALAGRAEPEMLLVVGAPLRCRGRLLNCAVVINGGRIVGVVPKTYIPNYKEFYEKRWMTSALTLGDVFDEIEIAGRRVPLGTDLLFAHGRAVVAIDVCEDLWAPVPPSSIAAINGANVIVNLSASNEVVGKHEFLDRLIRHQSGQAMCGYVYASAGYGESTTDLVFAGKAIIAENGALLAESERFTREPKHVIADLDLGLLDHERRVNTTFGDSLALYRRAYRREDCESSAPGTFYDEHEILHAIPSMPFVPQECEAVSDRCREIVNIQTFGLIRRLEHTGVKNVVIGISGGLDSTLALMIAVRAFDLLGLPRTGIHAITMPGFGTSGRTHANALRLMEALGVTSREISIAAAVTQHFSDIGHDASVHDVTYENSQARERTQILMDMANKTSGLVLGTGDLSELALGWATFNGDHMSMYNVNASIPKTLARHLVMWLAEQGEASTPQHLVIHETLLDVLATPISPELTPTDAHGEIAQKTEDLVGPYDLNDFFLFNLLRHGFTTRKIERLARQAFAGQYSEEVIAGWLKRFMRRFHTQQFKRSCLPDGPKVGTVSLSPRGDWRMPSDVPVK